MEKITSNMYLLSSEIINLNYNSKIEILGPENKYLNFKFNNIKGQF